MTPFSAALSTLCLTHADAAELLAHENRAIKITMVQDWARGKSRIPPGVWERLTDLFEAVEAAADDILSDQAEACGSIDIIVDLIPIGHPALRCAAAARAVLVVGPTLINIRQSAEALT